MQGIFTVEQVAGPPASIHGYTIEQGQKYSMFNISSQSLMSIENSSTLTKQHFDDENILSLFDQYNISLTNPDIVCQLIQRAMKAYHTLSIFYVEQFQTVWIESMKQYSQTDLSSNWLFYQQKFSNDNDDNGDDIKRNLHGFQSLWDGMGAFKDCQVRIIRSSSLRTQ